MTQEIFGHTPIQFVDENGKPVTAQAKVNLSKGDPYKPRKGYAPTARIVVCTKCHTVGNLEFPQGFSGKAGDRIMDGKPIMAICLRCNKEVEMRPLTPQEVRQHLPAVVERYTELYEDHIVHKKCPVVNPAVVLTEVLGKMMDPPGEKKIITEGE